MNTGPAGTRPAHSPSAAPRTGCAPSGPATWQQTVGTVLARGVVPAWLAAGSLLKLAEMNPLLLPPPVRTVVDAILDAFHMSKQDGYGPALRIIVAAELTLALIMVLVPALSRWVAAGVLSLFVLILGVVLLQGASSCGCFGASGPPPWAVLLVDGALLAGVLSFPVRRCASAGSGTLRIAGSVVAAAFAGSMLAFLWQPPAPDHAGRAQGDHAGAPHTESPAPPAPPAPPQPNSNPPVQPQPSPPVQPQPNPNPNPNPNPPATPVQPAPPAVPASGPTPWPPAPPKLQQYYAPEFEKWVGKRLDQQDLALIIQRPLPINPNEGRIHIVLMREDCDHCHELLNRYFSGPLDIPTLAVVIPDATGEPLENPCVNCKMATLVKGVPYVIQTPVLMTVKDGVVLDVCPDVDNAEAVRKTLNAGK